MKILTPEVKVGIFTLLAGVALVFLSFKTAGVPLFKKEKEMKFFMNFSTVSGVEVKSKIRLSGVEIGYVEDIILEDQFAKVVANLTQDVLIRKNALATIRTEGLLGERYIEINQGTADAPVLQNGEFLERTQDPADISDLLNKLGAALDDIRQVTSSVKNVFGTLEGQKTLKSALENIDIAAGTFRSMLAENRVAFSEASKNFATISREFADRAPELAKNLESASFEVDRFMTENRENLTNVFGNLSEITADIKAVIKENRENLRTTLTRTADAADSIDKLMTAMREMSDAMEGIAKKINDGEGTVGKLISDDEVYENLNSTLAGARQLFDQIDTVKLSLGMRIERQQDEEKNKGFISVLIAPREDKYYRLEVTEDQRLEDASNERTTLTNLLYTITIAKRYSDLTLRGGIIESSAGFGADYHLFSDRFTLSAEIFNMSGYNINAEDPQLKAELRINFQDYFFLYLGADEILNDYYRTYLFGGGILFGEDDLKLALGLF